LQKSRFGSRTHRQPAFEFLTGAAEHGASIFKMMDVSLHKSVDTLRGYIRRADRFKQPRGGRIPLSRFPLR
jgi:hypothetical protein